MPRLSTRLIKSAWRISPLIALLLRSCRDLPSAKNELRWISEHVTQAAKSRYQAKLFKLCKARSRGVPLQYILGTQPFGELEIKCRPGVLIPRSETEAYTLEIGRLMLDDLRHQNGCNIKSQQQHRDRPEAKPEPTMRILDICSGTGCISLSLYAQLRHACPDLQVVGLDISPKAINLSRENIIYNNLLPQGNQSVSYHKGDIFSPSTDITELLGLYSDSPSSKNSEFKSISSPREEHKWDLVISNPPYISSSSFSRDTTRSVRNFEPKVALVPLVAPATDDKPTSLTSICRPEDIFYARILDLSKELKPRRILFEVADLEQARRVAELALSSCPSPGIGDKELGTLSDMYRVIEIWRDDPPCTLVHSTETEDMVKSTPEDGKEETKTLRRVTVNGREILIRGSGNVRSVYFYVGTGKGTFDNEVGKC